MAIENGTNSYMPPDVLKTFENEISTIMAFLGTEKDYLLFNGESPDTFLNFWKKIGKQLPEFISSKQITTEVANQIEKTEPWGWSQLITKQHEGIVEKQQDIPFLTNKTDYKQFFSRNTSLKLIHNLANLPLPNIASIPKLPQRITSHEPIISLLNKNPTGIVLKTLWSSSGRGLIFIRHQTDYQQNKSRIDTLLKKHGALIAEPIYNKVQDASLQFIINDNNDYNFLGINYFNSDEQGRFQSEYIHIPESVKKELPKENNWIEDIARKLIISMQHEKIHRYYRGPIGVDVMFFRNTNNELKLYPLLEANLRYNMGLVNTFIKKLIKPNSNGHWQISTFKPGNAINFYNKQKSEHPVKLENGLIKKGFFPLTPFNKNTRFAAYGFIY